MLDKGGARTQIQSPHYFCNHKTVPEVCTEVIKISNYLSMYIHTHTQIYKDRHVYLNKGDADHTWQQITSKG